MTIIGFSLSKVMAQQQKVAKGGLKIGTNIKLESVEKTAISFDEGRGALKVKFLYEVKYEPGVGSIELNGEILFMVEKAAVESLLKGWEKEKSLPKKVSEMILAHIMQKCAVEAIILARDIGLPPPVPMPKFKSPTVKKTVKKATKK